MRKYVVVLVGMLISLVISGCGGSSTSATILPGNATAPITSTDDLTNLTFKNHSSSGFSKFQLNPDTGDGIKRATWGSTSIFNGTWTILNGNIVITDNINPNHQITFTRIQKEATYWLVFDASTNNICRLYFDINAFNTDKYDPTFVAGTRQNGTVLPAKINVTTFAGSLTTTPPGQAGALDTTPTNSLPTFNQPIDITYDGNQFYYVLDYNSNSIRKIDKTGNVSTLPCTASDTGLAVTFNGPQGITTDGSSLFVSDTGNHVIRQVYLKELPAGFIGNTKIIAGTLSVAGAIDTTTGTGTEFNSPAGITTDGTNLYVADSGNHTIRKIVISSTAVSTLAGFSGNIGTADGNFTAARFNTPIRLTTDGSKLYVCDLNNRIVRSVQIATGDVATIAGNAAVKAGQAVSDDSSQLGTSALFSHPIGITTDGTYLYVTDLNNITLPKPGVAPTDANKFNNVIRRIEISPKYTVSALAGGKSYPDIAQEGDGTSALFAGPRGIIWDGTSLLVTNGGTAFTTDGVIVSNQTSVYNVIFKVSP